MLVAKAFLKHIRASLHGHEPVWQNKKLIRSLFHQYLLFFLIKEIK